MDKTNNLIIDLTFEFAIEIIEFTELLESKRKFVIAKQLLKSGTSIGANTRESQNSESRADFIRKLKIAAKEADETEYWLLLCHRAKSYPDSEYLFDKINHIQRTLTKIISSSKNNK